MVADALAKNVALASDEREVAKVLELVEPFATRLSAPSWRQVIDVGNWDASGGIHVPGQSGQPGSRHYRDLSRRWRTNRQFPLYWSPLEVRRHARTRLVLHPVPGTHAPEPGGRT